MSVSLENKRPGVTHYVQDCKQAAEWYRDMLGFEIGPHDYNSFVEMFMGGEYMFHLTPAREGMVPHPAPVIRFNSCDIEHTHSALQSKGLEVGPLNWYPDYSSFTVRDMDGNAIAIWQDFEMRVREMGELLLVGINVYCAEGSDYITAIPKLAHELKLRVNEIPHLVNPHLMIGAFKGDSDPEDGYWACVQVERFDDIPKGMLSIIVPPNRYAVKWHYGHRSKASITYGKFQKLIDEAGFQQIPQSWGIEILRNWGSPEEGEIEMDLYCTIV